MSLLDDVSVVVTPNGYKAGTLYGVIPTYAEGSELVVNGDFATDTDWTKGTGWTISGGKANYDGVANSSNFSQTVTPFAGKSFVVEGSASNITQGFVYISLGGIDVQIVVNSNGSFKHYVSISSGSSVFFILARNNFIGSIDNISCKEVTASDMDVTRATAATRVDENGLVKDVLSNVPRIDYTGGGCPHILAEPQRTNLVTDSQTFTGALSQVSRVSNSTDIVDPFGTNTAFKFTVLTSGADAHTRITKSISVTNFSVSIYVNGLAGQKFQLFLARDSYTQYFDTSKVLSGGWERIELNGTFSTASTTVIIGLEFGFTADDSVAGQEYYLTGLQLEEGSYSTSYIPTSGSTVTRNQDLFTRDGIASLINSTEGVLFAEIVALTDNDATNRSICLSDGTTDNRILFRYEGNNLIRGFVISGGTINANFSFTYNNINNLKFAIKWKVNDFAYWVNGTEVATDTSGATPTGLNKLAFDDNFGNNFFGKVKQIQVYKTALTDAQLTSLTT